MSERHGPEDEVNWNGVLEPEERRRILARIHSAFGQVGARVPDSVEVEGRRLRLKEAVFAYLEKDRLSGDDLRAVEALSEALQEKVQGLESSIAQDDLSESAAVDLMREVLGILRALDHLRNLRGDPARAGPARTALMERVNDERRWRDYLKQVR